MEREYFCLVGVDVHVPREGVKQRVVERRIHADPERHSTQDLFNMACEATVAYLGRYEDYADDQITITGFNFYLNRLPG